MNLILYHGNLHTMDSENPSATAMRVADGFITHIGSDEEILKYWKEGDQQIDLKGKTVLPGFVDGHSHFSGLANSLMQCDLSSAKSFADIVSLMKTFLAENPVKAGGRIVGCNYDHNFLKEKRHPDKFLLDQISREHEVVIVHASSHMGAVNSLALKQAGITEDTPDPDGGRYGRVNGVSGEPDGYMEENAFIHFQEQGPSPDMEQLLHCLVKAQEIYASFGITTIQEGMTNAGLFSLLDYAAKNHLLKLDVAAYLDLQNCRKLLKDHPEYRDHYQDHLKIGGYKVFLDGSPQGRTAWMQEPYEGSDFCGYPVLTDERLHELILWAAEDGRQLLAHCNGDAAAEQFITQFEAVQKEHPDLTFMRPVMVHAQLVRKEQLERMSKLSMMPSFFVAHTYFWGDIHLENFGKKRASGISPAGTAKKLGLPFTFHQDSPVLPPDMMKTVWCAVNRETRNGVVLGEEERISVEDALQAITINGAYQYFEESSKGSLTEGKQADFIILEQDPTKVPKKELADIGVLATFKDGVCVWKRPDAV